jgi:hypothetical protein
MKDPAPGCALISAARPRAARLLEGYSPKLRRGVQLFDHPAFALWIGLGADAAVIALCERSARTGPAASDQLTDFWVQRADGEESVLVARGNVTGPLPVRIDGIDVRYVADAERPRREPGSRKIYPLSSHPRMRFFLISEMLAFSPASPLPAAPVGHGNPYVIGLLDPSERTRQFLHPVRVKWIPCIRSVKLATRTLVPTKAASKAVNRSAIPVCGRDRLKITLFGPEC